MELGRRIKQARLEAGLSQRQLCGGEVTRNMLSQIENGAASPSMSTLRYLAARLGRPLGWFLEEAPSVNSACMEKARQAYQAGAYADALERLRAYQPADRVFTQEYGLLLALCYTALARQAVEENRLPYARELLAHAREAETIYPLPDCTLLQLQAGQAVTLPSLDETLFFYAKHALQQQEPQKAQGYLQAMEEKTGEGWHFAMGQSYFDLGDFAQAAKQLQLAAKTRQVYAMLESCFRELGDFEKAYFYACAQREAAQ